MAANRLARLLAVCKVIAAQDAVPSDGPAVPTAATGKLQLGFMDSTCTGQPMGELELSGPSDGGVPSSCITGSTMTGPGMVTVSIKYDSCIDDMFQMSIYADELCAMPLTMVRFPRDNVMSAFAGVCSSGTVNSTMMSGQVFLRIVDFSGTLPECSAAATCDGGLCFNSDLELSNASFCSTRNFSTHVQGVGACDIQDTCSGVFSTFNGETAPTECQSQRMDSAARCCRGGFYTTEYMMPQDPEDPMPMPVDGGGGGDHHEPVWSEDEMYLPGDPAPWGAMCRNDGFTAGMNRSMVCGGITAAACCDNGGRFDVQVCNFPMVAAGEYASTLALCLELGGSEEQTWDSCNTSYPVDFPGVDWCQRRACEGCGHSWADDLRDKAACCGSEGTVCDTAASSESICADPNDFMPDHPMDYYCDGVDQDDCCAMGGNYHEASELDQCSVLRGGDCHLAGAADTTAMESACVAAGGTFRPSVTSTCATRMAYARGWGGVDTCNDQPCDDCGHTVADELQSMMRGCCGNGTFVCSSGESESAGDPDLCLSGTFDGTAIYSVECLNLATAADCTALQSEHMPSTQLDRYWSPANEEGMGCGEPSRCDVHSIGGDSAEERCELAGGTFRSSMTCNEWTGRAVESVGPFANMWLPCGSFVGDGEDLNSHLFIAGGACCSDGISQCMGLDVTVVSGEMTLNMDIPSDMSAEELVSALKTSIASQVPGLNESEVGNVTVSVVVKGTAPMVVGDPAAFVASAVAKAAVEAGLAIQVGVAAEHVTATLSLEASEGATTPAPAATDTTTTAPATRRLEGTVIVTYDITADLANSATLTSSLQAADATTSLAAHINTELAAEGIEVEVQEIEAESEVTISYEIRTVDSSVADTAQTVFSDAAAGAGSAGAGFTTSLTSELADLGHSVTIEVTFAEPEVEVSEATTQTAAPSSSPTSSSAFRLGHGDVAVAMAAIAAFAHELL